MLVALARAAIALWQTVSAGEIQPAVHCGQAEKETRIRQDFGAYALTIVDIR